MRKTNRCVRSDDADNDANDRKIQGMSFASDIPSESKGCSNAGGVQSIWDTPRKGVRAIDQEMNQDVANDPEDDTSHAKMFNWIVDARLERSNFEVPSVAVLRRLVQRAPNAVVKQLLRHVRKIVKKGGVAVLNGSMGEAAEVLLKAIEDGGELPSVIDFNILMWVWCRSKNMKRAVAVLDRLRDAKVRPNAVSFTTLIRGFCELKRMDDAMKVLDRMRDSEVRPNAVSFTTLIRGLCELKRMDDAMKVLDQMRDSEVRPNAVSFNTLIRGFCELKRMDDAMKVLDRMLKFSGS